jgi:hypothetical protein
LCRREKIYNVYIENQISPLRDAAYHFGRNDAALI